MLGKFKFIFHICAMKETLDFFIVKVEVKKIKGSCEAALFSCQNIGINQIKCITLADCRK